MANRVVESARSLLTIFAEADNGNLISAAYAYQPRKFSANVLRLRGRGGGDAERAEITAMKIQGLMLIDGESDDLAEALSHERALQTLERLALQRVSAPALTSFSQFIGSWTRLRHLWLLVPTLSAAHEVASAVAASLSVQEVSVDRPIWDDSALEEFGRSGLVYSFFEKTLRRNCGKLARLLVGLQGVSQAHRLLLLNLDWNEFDTDSWSLLKRINRPWSSVIIKRFSKALPMAAASD
ncbi:hypothetical protein BJ742DRAFT_766616 [Cladochytrium replicatum]|nr:hypothetical protein BJ742DRAFT_766616 [Cladochytrium replicatum]